MHIYLIHVQQGAIAQKGLSMQEQKQNFNFTQSEELIFKSTQNSDVCTHTVQESEIVTNERKDKEMTEQNLNNYDNQITGVAAKNESEETMTAQEVTQTVETQINENYVSSVPNDEIVGIDTKQDEINTPKIDDTDNENKLQNLNKNKFVKTTSEFKDACRVFLELLEKEKTFYDISDEHKVSTEKNYIRKDLIKTLRKLLNDSNDTSKLKPNDILKIILKGRTKIRQFTFLIKLCIRHNPNNNCYFIYENNNWYKKDRMDMSLEIKRLAQKISTEYFLSYYFNNEQCQEFLNKINRENFVTQFLYQVPTCDYQDNEVYDSLIPIILDNKNYGVHQYSKPVIIENEIFTIYEEGAKAPKWKEFLSQVFESQELIDYVQTVVGYCLSTRNKEQACFLLLGSGANGKTTFLEVIKKLLGYQAIIVDNSILTKNGKLIKKEYLKLIDSNVAIINEMDSNATIKADVFKILTGGDTIEIFDKTTSTKTFRVNAKFMVACNSMPTFSENSDAVWRRIKIIPFNKKFERENRNLYILDELVAELPGILNWAIEGYKRWESNKGLVEPQCVIDEIENARDTLDPIKDFIKSECEEVFDKSELSKNLYIRYNKWCKDNACLPIGQNKFGIMLTQRGYHQKRMTKGRGFVGLCLKAETINDTQQ